MPVIRIAKIVYDHHEVKFDKDGTETIGQQVDKHIADTIKAGFMISEVTFAVEGIEEQVQLRQAYENAFGSDLYGEVVPAEDYPRSSKAKRHN